jgi:hypothetical protein
VLRVSSLTLRSIIRALSSPALGKLSVRIPGQRPGWREDTVWYQAETGAGSCARVALFRGYDKETRSLD